MSDNAVNSILVPLDGTTFSERAVAYGIYIAKRININLIGLYADRPLEGSPTEEIIVQTFREDCRRSGISPDIRKVADLSAAAILSATEDAEGRLLLLPRQGSVDSPLSVPVNPAESALCGLTVPQMYIPPSFLEIESMGIIYDGGSESVNALDMAVLLSSKAAWPLTILISSEGRQQVGVLNRELDDYFELHDELPVDWDTVILSGPQEEAVIQFVRDGSIELLVLALSAQEKPPLQFLRESPIPLIVIC
jgi:nucleotide-binding universal stress UspA family protein